MASIREKGQRAGKKPAWHPVLLEGMLNPVSPGRALGCGLPGSRRYSRKNKTMPWPEICLALPGTQRKTGVWSKRGWQLARLRCDGLLRSLQGGTQPTFPRLEKPVGKFPQKSRRRFSMSSLRAGWLWWAPGYPGT